MAQWLDGQDHGGNGKLTLCLPLGWGHMGVPVCLSRVAVAQIKIPGLALMRQQRSGNNKVARLVPLVTMGTSLVACGKFSGDKSEGREEGQMESVMERYPSHAKGDMEHSQKILEMI